MSASALAGELTPRPSSVQDRSAHAGRLIAAIDAIQIQPTASATYIEVLGRPGEPFLADKFDVSGLALLNTQDADPDRQIPGRAVVKASTVDGGLAKLRKKLNDFAEKDRPPNDDCVSSPYNADLANSIDAIAEAGLRELWRHPTKPFPLAEGALPWEVWLEPDEVDRFLDQAAEHGLSVYPDRLTFTEDTIVLVEGDVGQMTRTVTSTGAVRAVLPPGAPIDYVEGLEAEEQAEWVEDVLRRTEYQAVNGGTTSYVTLLDTGVSLAHGLIQPALDAQDRHAAIFGWDLNDNHGHGTRMAGLDVR